MSATTLQHAEAVLSGGGIQIATVPQIGHCSTTLSLGSSLGSILDPHLGHVVSMKR